MSKYQPVEGVLFVEIEESPKLEGIKSSNKGANAIRDFQKATIKASFDEKVFPINSIWMMGDVPPQKIRFFGEEITIIQERDLYARIN